MTQPKLVFIFAKGCPACAEAKPEFKKLIAQLPSWSTGMVDIDEPGLNLDFPVQYTPTLYFAFKDKRFSTDPPTLGRSFTQASMKLWLEECVKRIRGA